MLLKVKILMLDVFSFLFLSTCTFEEQKHGMPCFFVFLLLLEGVRYVLVSSRFSKDTWVFLTEPVTSVWSETNHGSQVFKSHLQNMCEYFAYILEVVKDEFRQWVGKPLENVSVRCKTPSAIINYHNLVWLSILVERTKEELF